MSPPLKLVFNSACLFQDLLSFLYMCFVSILFKEPGAKVPKDSSKREGAKLCVVSTTKPILITKQDNL